MPKLDLLWIIPFICFIAGYYTISRLATVQYVQTPAIVGLPLQEALKIISSYSLHGQIMAEKEDEDLPAGLVTDQRPHAGQNIKAHQPIYMTVIKRPPLPQAPMFIGLDKATIDELAKVHKIRIKWHNLESRYPANCCIAQYPLVGAELVDRTVHVYVSQGISSIRLLPNFKGKPVIDVLEFLKAHNIAVQLFHATDSSIGFVDVEHQCIHCIVQDQKPAVGTLIDVQKPLSVQLSVVEQVPVPQYLD